MALERQSSALPPAQPSYLLRGHTAHIHSVRFVRHNARLLTGDADGWVVYWKLETKRPLAVWKAHDGAILGTEEWGRNNIVTHGRDNSLRIWQLRPADESSLSTILPAEDSATPRPKPWLLYTLPVNTLNFCAFSMCCENASGGNRSLQAIHLEDEPVAIGEEPILVATPAADDKKINVYQFPDERLRYIIPKVSTADTGMVMAVKITHHHASSTILVLSGYEGGLTAVHRLPPRSTTVTQEAQLIYLSQPHTQPVLSLDVSPRGDVYYTSSADATVAVHCIPELEISKYQIKNTATSGLQPQGISQGQLSKLDDIAKQESFDTSSTTPEGHDEFKQDISTTSVLQEAPISFAKQSISSSQAAKPNAAGLSSLLSAAPPQGRPQPPPPRPKIVSIQQPSKVNNTKHAGQQSLRVRSDGRIFATGGWDSRVRIYSSKTLKEVAVLKWHKEGVYAVDFAQVLESKDLQDRDEQGSQAVLPKETGLSKLQRHREEQMQLKHWIVAGAKDGKISLWEIF